MKYEVDIVHRLFMSASIRRNIAMKNDGKVDRIAHLLDQAAQEIIKLRVQKENTTCQKIKKFFQNLI